MEIPWTLSGLGVASENSGLGGASWSQAASYKFPATTFSVVSLSFGHLRSTAALEYSHAHARARGGLGGFLGGFLWGFSP